jgi:hypothetical protein
VLQVKIVCSPLLGQLWLLCAMPQVNPLSFIAAKAISESVLQSLNVFLVFAIQCRSVHH